MNAKNANESQRISALVLEKARLARADCGCSRLEKQNSPQMNAKNANESQTISALVRPAWRERIAAVC
jgi:hypothetical protein